MSILNLMYYTLLVTAAFGVATFGAIVWMLVSQLRFFRSKKDGFAEAYKKLKV